MRKIISLALAACVVITLSGCKNSPEISLINKSRKIGVISLLRDEFHSIYVGTTIFQNKTNHKKTPGWALSSFAENLLLSKIRSNRVFSVKKAKYKRSELLNIYQNTQGPFSSKNSYLNKLSQIGKSQGLDTLVIVSPIVLDQVMMKSPTVGEYGHYHLYNPILKDHLCTFVKYGVSIYDVKKGEMIGTRFTTNTKFGQGAALCPQEPIGGVKSVLPENYTHQESYSAYPAAQISTMKSKIKSLMRAALTKDLECLKLTKTSKGTYREEGCGIFDKL